MTAARSLAFGALLLFGVGTAYADRYSDTVQLFKNAGSSAAFFSHSYAYAVFPTVGEGAFIVGGAHGTGRVYVGDKYTGDSTVTQLSVGFQAGGKAYSEIVFFEDKRALDEFESGSFEFDAGASAIAVTMDVGGAEERGLVRLEVHLLGAADEPDVVEIAGVSEVEAALLFRERGDVGAGDDGEAEDD